MRARKFASCLAAIQRTERPAAPIVRQEPPAQFYDPATRTFRPLCRQAILTVAAGPLAAFMVSLAWGMFQ